MEESSEENHFFKGTSITRETERQIKTSLASLLNLLAFSRSPLVIFRFMLLWTLQQSSPVKDSDLPWELASEAPFSSAAFGAMMREILALKNLACQNKEGFNVIPPNLYDFY